MGRADVAFPPQPEPLPQRVTHVALGVEVGRHPVEGEAGVQQPRTVGTVVELG